MIFSMYSDYKGSNKIMQLHIYYLFHFKRSGIG